MKHRGDGWSWAYIDQLTLLVVAFLAIAVLAQVKQTKAKTEDSNGSLAVQLTWDMARDADVDLWVKTPDDKPVGFQRSHGKHADLVRDDLGRSGDLDSRNVEIVFVRNAVAGEYIVNAVLYHSADGKVPVSVRLLVRDAHGAVVVDRAASLGGAREELTIARFRIDGSGYFVYGSLNSLQQRLFKRGD